MIIRKCKKLKLLDTEIITALDRDIAKNFEINNTSDIRPNTSAGRSSKRQDLFYDNNIDDNLVDNQTESFEKTVNIENNINKEFEKINNENIYNNQDVNTINHYEEDKNKPQENFKKNNEEKLVFKNETHTTFSFGNKIISQIDLPSKNSKTHKKVKKIYLILNYYSRL